MTAKQAALALGITERALYARIGRDDTLQIRDESGEHYDLAAIVDAMRRREWRRGRKVVRQEASK